MVGNSINCSTAQNSNVSEMFSDKIKIAKYNY